MGQWGASPSETSEKVAANQYAFSQRTGESLLWARLRAMLALQLCVGTMSSRVSGTSRDVEVRPGDGICELIFIGGEKNPGMREQLQGIKWGREVRARRWQSGVALTRGDETEVGGNAFRDGSGVGMALRKGELEVLSPGARADG